MRNSIRDLWLWYCSGVKVVVVRFDFVVIVRTPCVKPAALLAFGLGMLNGIHPGKPRFSSPTPLALPPPELHTNTLALAGMVVIHRVKKHVMIIHPLRFSEM